MTQADTRTRFQRTPLLIVHHEEQRRHDVYGTIGDDIALQAQLLRGDEDSDSVIVATHPTGAPSYLPMFTALGRAGYHVLACANRYTNGDQSLIMERVVLDLGAWVRHAKETLGYKKVILAGWSGGAAVAMTYQAQAEKPTIMRTPAGDPCDLTSAGLVAADGIFLLAAHRSRHHLLTEWLDPAITDETSPLQRDQSLDLFDPSAPNQPPYSEGFLAGFRAAQIARNRKITAWVRERLDHLQSIGRPDDELAFVVHGTMADPRWLDPTVDPNDRIPRHSYLGAPDIANTGPAGLARFTTLRSWLSQWSYDLAQADAVESATKVTVPIIVVQNSADDACPPSHIEAVFAAVTHSDKQFNVVQGADHYYSGPGRRKHLDMTVDLIKSWTADHEFQTPR
jgi:alpha-beta hydrolase superfamily lysophospholipase